MKEQRKYYRLFEVADSTLFSSAYKFFAILIIYLVLETGMLGTLLPGTVLEVKASHNSDWGLDRNLVDLIDKEAPNYYRAEWNISLSQYKAWIALIALRESGKGRYVAHSQYGGKVGNLGLTGDRFDHIDAGKKFRFSTGIGAFQLDRGGAQKNANEDWSHMPTIEKLNPALALLSVLRWHRDRFDKPGTTLAKFSRKSAWFAVKPSNKSKFVKTWRQITGKTWSESKNTKMEVGFNPPIVDDPFEETVRFIGKARWNLKRFNGCFDTWLIIPHNWRGREIIRGGYYYTYRKDTGWEVWVWNDPAQKFIYRFERKFTKTHFPQKRRPGYKLNQNRAIAYAGSTSSAPALAIDAPECQLRKEILIYYGNGAFRPDETVRGQSPGSGLAVYNRLKAYYEAQGFPVTYTDRFPSDLSPFKLIIIPSPGAADDSGTNFFTTNQVESLKNFLWNGGRLVILGDFGGLWGINTINDLLSRLGVGIRQNPDQATSDADSCPPVTDITPDQTTRGVNSIDFSASSSLSLSGRAISLVRIQDDYDCPTGVSGATIVAVDQIAGSPPRPGSDVIVIGDTQGLDDYSFSDPAGDGVADNWIFADNLVNFTPGIDSLSELSQSAVTVSTRKNIKVSAVSVSSNYIKFFAKGQNIQEIQVGIFNLSGRLVFNTGWVQNGFIWNLLNNRGEIVANGVYLYVVTVRDSDGSLIRGEAKKLVILRQQFSLSTKSILSFTAIPLTPFAQKE